MRCPGQDMRFWKSEDIFEIPCPRCGGRVEFFKDEVRRRCRCGHEIVNPKVDFGCASWCPYAEQCIGTVPDDVKARQRAEERNSLKERIGLEMKKYFVFIFVMIFAAYAYAASSSLLEMRNKIIDESKEIKPLLTSAKNAVLISSIWDSCIMTVSQLDAYFSMVGILDSIKNENLSESSVDYLINWLSEIKSTNALNIKSIDVILGFAEKKVKPHMEKLKIHFDMLNNQLEAESKRLSLFKKVLPRAKNLQAVPAKK